LYISTSSPNPLPPGEGRGADVQGTETIIFSIKITKGDWNSVVSIRDLLRVAWFGIRTPVEARFSGHIQSGLVAHPASSAVGTGSLFRR